MRRELAGHGTNTAHVLFTRYANAGWCHGKRKNRRPPQSRDGRCAAGNRTTSNGLGALHVATPCVDSRGRSHRLRFLSTVNVKLSPVNILSPTALRGSLDQDLKDDIRPGFCTPRVTSVGLGEAAEFGDGLFKQSSAPRSVQAWKFTATTIRRAVATTTPRPNSVQATEGDRDLEVPPRRRVPKVGNVVAKRRFARKQWN
jgi:hypothetical protein